MEFDQYPDAGEDLGAEQKEYIDKMDELNKQSQQHLQNSQGAKAESAKLSDQIEALRPQAEPDAKTGKLSAKAQKAE